MPPWFPGDFAAGDGVVGLFRDPALGDADEGEWYRAEVAEAHFNEETGAMEYDLKFDGFDDVVRGVPAHEVVSAGAATVATPYEVGQEVWYDDGEGGDEWLEATVTAVHDHNEQGAPPQESVLSPLQEVPPQESVPRGAGAGAECTTVDLVLLDAGVQGRWRELKGVPLHAVAPVEYDWEEEEEEEEEALQAATAANQADFDAQRAQVQRDADFTLAGPEGPEG